MATRAIKPKRDDTMLANFQSQPERAPSIVQEDQPTVSRFLALLGLVLAALGLFATVVAPISGKSYIIGPATGMLCLSAGLFFLLFHALTDQDLQYRLMYLVLGYVGIAAGTVLRVMPLGGKVGGLFLIAGLPCLILGLLFVLTAIRHETDAKMRFNLSLPLGVLGFAMVILGSFAGHISQQYLLVEGVLISVVGLVFIASFLGTQGYASDIGYRTGLILGAIGLAGLVLALLRSFLSTTPFFVPSGLILTTLSLVYLIIGLAICTDWPILVIFRRELKAFFFSPIGYLVFLGNVLIAWIWLFVFMRVVAASSDPRAGGMPEPIVHFYLFNPFLIVALVFIVPVITMRLVSEEKRSGTLEVLLTAPLSEVSLVTGKFLAALTVYILSWFPWFGFLVALRIYGGTEFEYRPLLSFLPVMIVTGMAFLSMGIFFSATTSNQIIAAVLTFVAMVLQWMPYLLKWIL